MTLPLTQQPRQRILALVTDAFGSHGGIARYNRDLIAALAGAEHAADIVVLPRIGDSAGSQIGERVTQLAARRGRLAYARAAWQASRRHGPFDVVFCGHLYMVPLAAVIARRLGVPLWLQVHGIEAWAAPGRLVRWAADRASLVTSVSRATRARMLSWSGLDDWRIKVLPNTFDAAFSAVAREPHRKKAVGRLDLTGRDVILTVARLSAGERYKGHDRVIAALPRVIARCPAATYVIVGDGDDRSRLEALAGEAGVADRVCFAGQVGVDELSDFYRAADVFVMPSTGEGFGIVYLEAAAAGLPVIAGNCDGSVDALADGVLGTLVDPLDTAAIGDAIIDALEVRKPRVDVGRFATAHFARHAAGLARSLGQAA
ncbi:MAG: glycosyltransferase family 4 protein [Hyphomicrobiaceae bacterium]|nr:glycosyltransferase family 4 protein [Hyphomicrobiaceae bacterium]